jgi:hypothetical protein
MTTRSERHHAEQAVIDNAYRLRAAVLGGSPADIIAKQRILISSVADHERLGLAQLSQRGATNSVDTSNQAATSLGNISGLAQRCYDEIVLAGGLTTDQLEQILNGKHQTISARVNDLINKNWIVDSGLRRKTRSGRDARVWRPSQLAMQVNP